MLAFALDTEALISDLNEQSKICAQSLFLRSKPSPARTWSAKWKRDSWTQHLSGRILKPSLGESFVTEWTSSLGATRVNHSAQQESVSELKIPDTSGPTLQMELLQCDQVSVSLKTSRDISRWGCPTLLKTWEGWVTERRGAYSLRLKSAHLTKESGSSSWPTANARDWKDSINGTHPPSRPKLSEQTLGQAVSSTWSTPSTMNGAMYPETNWEKRNSPSLATQASWPTPCAMEAEKAGKFNKGQMGQSLSAMANRGELGLHAPDNRSSVGNRQESWPNMRTRGMCGGSGAKAMLTRSLGKTEGKKMFNAGKLNPRWVETLMGLPVGWVMPSCTSPVTIEPTNSDSSETESCQQPQNSHGQLF